MSSKRSTSRLTGFTLVEILVVLVLFALIAGAIAPNLSGASKRSQTDKLIANLIELDARARVLAGRHRACYITFDEAQNQLQLTVIDDAAEIVQTFDIPHFAEFEFANDSQAVVFDLFGQTNAYRYRVAVDQISIQIDFNGLTGWHEITRELPR